MSSQQPPQGPPYGGPPRGGPPGPPQGPPGGPPQGPPPGGWGQAAPLGPPSGEPQGKPKRRRGPLLAVLGVLALGLVGGGVWAAVAFFSTGPQAAEALPEDTLAYVGFDLDPSGGQKLEALRTLEKFPYFSEETGLDSETDSDLKESAFEFIEDLGGGCEGLDYGDDLGPWLGDRAGIGVFSAEEEPDVAIVVQVTDTDAAEDGLAMIDSCSAGADADAGEDDEEFAYAVGDEWAVLAPTQEIADDTLAGGDESSLADGDDYQRWTDAAGDSGVLTAYASADFVQEFSEDLGADFERSLGDFEGAALHVRFADEGLEVQTAGYNGLGGDEAALASENVTDVTDDLPSDTAAVLAIGFEDGWGDAVLDQFADLSGVGRDELVEQAESELGIEVPEDVETLLGDGAALVASSDIDLEGLEDGSVQPDDVPVGVRVLTDDPDASEGVLDELRGQLGEGGAEVFESETEGDQLVVGPSSGYRDALLEGGDLGGQDAFTDVVPEADRSGSLFYLDLDVLDDYTGLIDSATGDDRISENLVPLRAVGVTGWVEDDIPRTLIRISTDTE